MPCFDLWRSPGTFWRFEVGKMVIHWGGSFASGMMKWLWIRIFGGGWSFWDERFKQLMGME
jgi:hypothetical protein